MAGWKDPVGRPQKWEDALRAAHYRLTGLSIADTARAAHVAQRTLERWVRCSWWARACEEVSSRYMESASEAALRTLFVSIEKGDAQAAKWYLERTDSRFAPPAITFRRERDLLRGLDDLTDEQLRKIEGMTDEEAMEFIQSGGLKRV